MPHFDRVICLSNVASERGVKQAGILKSQLHEQPTVQFVATRDLAALHTSLDALHPTESDLLVVNGGDGSLQAVLSELAIAQCAPTVGVLPGGSTNMSAYDINQHRRFKPCVAELASQLGSSTDPAVTERAVLRVTDGQRSRVGFFCGIGAVVEAIEYCHQELYAAGAKRREFTAGLAMLRAIWGVLRKQPPFAVSQPLKLEAYNAAASDEEQPASIVSLAPQAGALLVAASTLQRLLVGVRPHWGDEPGALRFTMVERDQRGLWFRLPGLLGLVGWPRPVASAGYHSHNCERLELTMAGGYTIDGELFVPATDKITLDVQQAFRFLVL